MTKCIQSVTCQRHEFCTVLASGVRGQGSGTFILTREHPLIFGIFVLCSCVAEIQGSFRAFAQFFVLRTVLPVQSRLS